MPFMPTSGPAQAEEVSRALYRLTRPDDAEMSETTQFLFAWRTAADGVTYMLWDVALVLPVHVARGPETNALLGDYVARGLLSPASASACAALVQARAGGTVTLGEITPPEWLAQMRPDSDAAMLFPPPVMP